MDGIDVRGLRLGFLQQEGVEVRLVVEEIGGQGKGVDHVGVRAFRPLIKS